MLTGNGKARPIRQVFENFIEEIYEKCDENNSTALLVFYGGGHGGEHDGVGGAVLPAGSVRRPVPHALVACQ